MYFLCFQIEKGVFFGYQIKKYFVLSNVYIKITFLCRLKDLFEPKITHTFVRIFKVAPSYVTMSSDVIFTLCHC